MPNVKFASNISNSAVTNNLHVRIFCVYSILYIDPLCEGKEKYAKKKQGHTYHEDVKK